MMNEMNILAPMYYRQKHRTTAIKNHCMCSSPMDSSKDDSLVVVVPVGSSRELS